MRCVGCGSAAVTERPERTAQGCRRFRCRCCGKQFSERSGTALNRAQYPSDVVALVVLWRLRCKLSLRDLPELLAVRGMVSSHEAVRGWEAKLTPALAEGLRRVRRGKVGRGWRADGTHLKVAGRWCCVHRAIDRSGAGGRAVQRTSRHGGGPCLLSLGQGGDPRKSHAISLASPLTGSRPTATTATRARSGPSWAKGCGTGPTAA